jgi:hypothetical protein
MVSSLLLRRVALVRTDVRRLLVAACVVPSSPIFVTLMKEAPGSSDTSVRTRATRRNNPEDTILHSHHREKLTSYREIQYSHNGSTVICCYFHNNNNNNNNNNGYILIGLKNAVFWDITPCGSCKNGSFGGAYRLNHQKGKTQRLLYTFFLTR